MEVANCRRRLVSLAMGRLARNASRAADTIVRISREGDSDAVRLRAARAVFSDLIQVTKFSDLEGRMHTRGNASAACRRCGRLDSRLIAPVVVGGRARRQMHKTRSSVRVGG